jgi:hypothetical protein
MPFQKKSHKYGAQPVTINGIRFASKAEGARYRILILLEKAGQVTELKLQPRYPLVACGATIGHYQADFEYFIGDLRIVEDVKGFKTPLYRWKKKHFEAQYGLSIRETK